MIKQKNVAVSIILSIITCGIYYIYLMYKLGERIDIIKQDNKKLQYGFNYCNNCTVSIFSCKKYSSI